MPTSSIAKHSFQTKFAALIDEVRRREDEPRFRHTLAVAEECCLLANAFSLSEKDAECLYAAGLLHDITKKENPDRQLCLARELNLTLTEDDIASPPVLHAITGAALAARDFADYADETVVQAIRAHTTGQPNMTLLDKLLFLADYIEPTRQHPICQQTRKKFYQTLAHAPDREAVLDQVLLEILENTASHVRREGRPIHQFTLQTIDWLQRNRSNTKKG